MSSRQSALGSQLEETPPAWCNGYAMAAIPFVEHGRSRGGLDCWGLVQLVYREQFGIELPAHDTGYATTGRESAAELARLIEQGKPSWRTIAEFDAAAGMMPLGGERFGDLLLIRQWGVPMHVAVVTARGWMLHTQEGVECCQEEYQRFTWRRRLLGLYRHASVGVV